MAWLEITLNTAPDRIEAVTAALTAHGFSDLVIEDQQEFETFLEENRAYWDYIDENLQKTLEGLSRIKLYLEDTGNQEAVFYDLEVFYEKLWEQHQYTLSLA